MKRLLLIPALALSVLVATPAAGAETLHASFKGQFAEAEFSSLDPSGCVVTDVFIFAVDGRVKETGHPVVTSSAAISIFQFDHCTGMALFDVTAFPTLAEDEFRSITSSTRHAECDRRSLREHFRHNNFHRRPHKLDEHRPNLPDEGSLPELAAWLQAQDPF